MSVSWLPIRNAHSVMKLVWLNHGSWYNNIQYHLLSNSTHQKEIIIATCMCGLNIISKNIDYTHCRVPYYMSPLVFVYGTLRGPCMFVSLWLVVMAIWHFCGFVSHIFAVTLTAVLYSLSMQRNTSLCSAVTDTGRSEVSWLWQRQTGVSYALRLTGVSYALRLTGG